VDEALMPVNVAVTTYPYGLGPTLKVFTTLPLLMAFQSRGRSAGALALADTAPVRAAVAVWVAEVRAYDSFQYVYALPYAAGAAMAGATVSALTAAVRVASAAARRMRTPDVWVAGSLAKRPIADHSP
jgi:uncharacterized RDD family membrane protein YckC